VKNDYNKQYFSHFSTVHQVDAGRVPVNSPPALHCSHIVICY